MPKHAKSSSSNQNRYSHPLGVSLAPAADPTTDMYNQRLAMQEYYTVASSSASLQPQLQQDYDATYAASTPTMAVPPVQHRPSSGAWTPQDDQTLLQARAQGLNWAQIQSRCFGNKTPNACRKRHERLMERRGADDGDKRKLERLAKEYMGMRKEIWGGLAARTGEKWNVVEAQVRPVSQAIQTARPCTGRCALWFSFSSLSSLFLPPPHTRELTTVL